MKIPYVVHFSGKHVYVTYEILSVGRIAFLNGGCRFHSRFFSVAGVHLECAKLCRGLHGVFKGSRQHPPPCLKSGLGSGFKEWPSLVLLFSSCPPVPEH